MRTAAMTRRRQGGIALIETVVVAPLLLFLVLLTAEVTNAFVDHNTLTKAVRNGGRHLAGQALLGSAGTVEISPQLAAETRNLVVYGNIAGAGPSILRGLAAGDVQVAAIGSDNVQVTVSYPYSGLLGDSLPALGFGEDTDLGITLEATVTMRAL